MLSCIGLGRGLISLFWKKLEKVGICRKKLGFVGNMSKKLVFVRDMLEFCLLKKREKKGDLVLGCTVGSCAKSWELSEKIGICRMKHDKKAPTNPKSKS